MKNRNKMYDSLILIMQFGINMIVPIFLCIGLGVFIYQRYGHPWLVILLFSLVRQRDSKIVTGWHRGFGRKKTRERLNQMLKRINDALPELILGILIYEIVVEFTGIWFVKDKLGYSIGLLIGAATAIGMAVHMAVVLRDSMDMAESGRTRRIALQYVLRYLVVVAVFFVTAYFEIGNVMVAFVGVMGLKVGAYVQPFTHKVILKLLGRGDESS